MKNLLYSLLAIVWLFPTSLLAQDNELPATTNVRQGQLYFSIGTEYRTGDIENVFKSRAFPNRGLDVKDLNRGAAFSYSLDYFFTQNLSLGFSHSLRYDHIHEATPDAIPGGASSNAVIADQYGLIMDYHLYMKYHFIVAKQEFFFQAGLSFLNNAPTIRKNPVSISSNGVERIDNTSLDLMDITSKFGLGYQKNRFSIMGGIYFSDENPFYQGANYILPYFELKYQLGNLLKKKGE